MYLNYFNLKEYPFNQCHNIDYYLDLKGHQDSLDVLLYGIQINDGIIKVVGEPGTGKSLICQLFMAKLPKEYLPIYISNPYVTASELLQHISESLGLKKTDFSNNSKTLDLIFDTAVALKKNDHKKIILIFDEGQSLSTENLEIIRILSNLQKKNEKLFHILLIGGLELEDRLKELEHFLQRISFSYRLPPLKEKDINDYMHHRMQIASKSSQPADITITPKARKLLYKKTKGIPRLVNLVCHKSLMLAYSLGVKIITKSIVKEAVLDTDAITSKSKPLIFNWWGRR